MRGFDVQNGTIIAYAAFSKRSSDPYTATDGLLKLSYNTTTRECTIKMMLPVKDQYTVCNVCICFMRRWASGSLKSPTTTTKLLPEQDSIDFEVRLHSSKLQQFLHELTRAYNGDEELSEKICKRPENRRFEKKLKNITWKANGNNYHERLCEYLNTLKL